MSAFLCSADFVMTRRAAYKFLFKDTFELQNTDLENEGPEKS